MEKNWKKLDPEDRGTWRGLPVMGKAKTGVHSLEDMEWKPNHQWTLTGVGEWNHYVGQFMEAKPATPPPFDGE